MKVSEEEEDLEDLKEEEEEYLEDSKEEEEEEKEGNVVVTVTSVRSGGKWARNK